MTMVEVNDIKQMAIDLWQSDHIILPSVTAAQFILESASGTSLLVKEANNYFGIKASAPWTGDTYKKASAEVVNRQASTPVSVFRKYASWQESVQDHNDFFVSTAYRKTYYAEVIGEPDYKKACEALGRTYATDPVYGEKLITIIEAKGLVEWDKQEESEETKMTRLIVLGHGKSKAGVYDPGATGNGTTEAEWLRGDFLTSLKKYATQVGGIDFYETNMFADRTASTITGYTEVTELHLDAAASSASGGHVIIKTGFSPDATDEAIRNVVKNNFGLVPYTQSASGFSYRDDLLNLNVFATRGIGYRLAELCFITNSKDMDYFKANYDKVARELIEAIAGVSLTAVPSSVVEPAQAIRTRVPASYDATITASGYSIDSAPWGEPEFMQWGMTDAIMGNKIYVYEESENGEYANAYKVGWIDKRAITREKQVVASILHLPNGQNWTTYPTEGPYTAGDVISLEGTNGESAYTVLGERNGGKVLIVDLDHFGQVGIYYDEDKGASIEKKYSN